jgi:hypothetical protein
MRKREGEASAYWPWGQHPLNLRPRSRRINFSAMDQRQGVSVQTFEGTVEEGQIRLKGNVRLPDKTRVFVIVPDGQVEQPSRVSSPRLANRCQVADFELEVVGDPLRRTGA